MKKTIKKLGNILDEMVDEVLEEGKKQKLICGMTEQYIRKKFFDREVGKMLKEIQGQRKVKENEVHELIAFMTGLKIEDKSVIEKVMDAFPGSRIIDDSEINPPTVDELMTGLNDDEWRTKADAAIGYIKEKLDNLRMDIAGKKQIPETYWLDTAIIFMSYQDILERDRIWKTQKYFAQITRLIDETGISRLEAENRSKLTKEFADYKYISLLLERMDKFDMLCKKKDAMNKYGN
jgi:hypothetical protein